jgi:subtilisin family serine protease
MSLGGGASPTLDAAVQRSITSGVTYAIAAGNEGQDACNDSPARVGAAITVGATDANDNRASFSNTGTCVDIFAPGVNIVSSFLDSDTARAALSGTSMASPHVAGAAALVLAKNPGFTPQQVRDSLVNDATPGKVRNPGAGSPNKLLFVTQ